MAAALDRTALRGASRALVKRIISGSHSSADSVAVCDANPVCDADTYTVAYRDGFLDGIAATATDSDADGFRAAIAAGLAILDAGRLAAGPRSGAVGGGADVAAAPGDRGGSARWHHAPSLRRDLFGEVYGDDS